MQDPKQRIIHRLKIAKGHLEKVITMVTNDEYCIDVVHQSLAVQAALKKTDQLVLENHLKNCVAEAVVDGNIDEAVDEIMKVLDKK